MDREIPEGPGLFGAPNTQSAFFNPTRLYAGQTFTCYIIHIVTADHFFISLVEDIDDFQQLETQLRNVGRVPLTRFIAGQPCLVRDNNDCLFRAIIKGEQDRDVFFFLPDIGRSDVCAKQFVFEVPNELLDIRPFAIECAFHIDIPPHRGDEAVAKLAPFLLTRCTGTVLDYIDNKFYLMLDYPIINTFVEGYQQGFQPDLLKLALQMRLF